MESTTKPSPSLSAPTGASVAAANTGSSRKIVIGVIAAAIAILLPHIPSSDAGFFSTFSPGNSNSIFPIFTIVLCAVYALFALGLNIVVGFAGLLDLGYVAFFLVGAYVAAWLMSGFFYNVNFSFLSGAFRPEGKTPAGVHLTFWLVVPIAAIVAAIVGVIIGAPTLRLKSDYLALVTLGFGEILPEVFRNAEKVTNGTKGIGPLDQIGTGPLALLPGINQRIGPSDYKAKYYVILVFLAFFAFVAIRLRDGKLGRAWMAIREDELAASLMGVPLMRTKLWSYAVGAAAGGVGGAFYATIVGTVNVDSFTFQLSIIILCSVILGGMGNVWGAILGGAVIAWVNYTGLLWTGNGYNGASGLKLWVIAAFVAVLGVVGALWLARTKGLHINWMWFGITAAVPTVGIFAAALASKIDGDAKRPLVWIALAGTVIALVALLNKLRESKALEGAPVAFAVITGAVLGLLTFRLVRSDFTVDLVKYQFGLFGLVLVLMMMFRPEGFIAAARSKAVKQSEATLREQDAQAVSA
jgi:branched-chain amino acid transport system permease protein